MTNPRLVLVFSGKRKSGKDFLTDEILKLTPKDSAVIIRLSGPLKEAYAREHGLDFAKLLDATEYKEKYRADMVLWGEERRNEKPSFFCELAIEKYRAKDFPIWIVSDARRLTDVEYFKENFPQQTKLCRILADDCVRGGRGWSFVAGVDDQVTECGLDQYEGWDVLLNNDGKRPSEELLRPCLDLINEVK